MRKAVEIPGRLLPEIDDVTRREFLIGSAGLLVLAPYGCGNEDESGVGGETISSETRTVDTPRGSVTIPADPQRMLTIYVYDLANALALGLPVIAGPGEQGRAGAPFPNYLVEMFGEELDGVTRIATQPEINFEQLAELQPDVILSAFFGDFDPGYELFEQIAPTVTYQYTAGETNNRVPWQTLLRTTGEQFACEDAAEDFIVLLARPGEPTEGFLERPVVAALNATRKDQVFVVSYVEWQYSRVGGILSVYDDVERYILEREIDTSGDFR